MYRVRLKLRLGVTTVPPVAVIVPRAVLAVTLVRLTERATPMFPTTADAALP